jgi:hypothetical protein
VALMAGVGPAHLLSGVVRQVGLVQTPQGVASAYDLEDQDGKRSLELRDLLATLEGEHVTIDVQVDDTD